MTSLEIVGTWSGLTWGMTPVAARRAVHVCLELKRIEWMVPRAEVVAVGLTQEACDADESKGMACHQIWGSLLRNSVAGELVVEVEESLKRPYAAVPISIAELCVRPPRRTGSRRGGFLTSCAMSLRDIDGAAGGRIDIGRASW